MTERTNQGIERERETERAREKNERVRGRKNEGKRTKKER